jgi:hypothetical protein
MADNIHPIGPLASGLGDGVQHGFRAVDSVAEGLRESLHLRATRRSYASHQTTSNVTSRPGVTARPGAPRATDTTGVTGVTPAPGMSGAITGELLRLFGEVLGTAGDVAQEVARTLSGYHPCAWDDQDVTLDQVLVQESATDVLPGEFTIWNTGAGDLRDVVFTATDLVGPNRKRISDTKVHCDPPTVTIPPNAYAKITVKVDHDPNRTLGDYRGMIIADPGGASVLLTLHRS